MRIFFAVHLNGEIFGGSSTVANIPSSICRLSAHDISTLISPEVDRDYGCQEVRNVAGTMEVLYKVVRDANVAFFAGDVETAYAVLTDTLRLFHVSYIDALTLPSNLRLHSNQWWLNCLELASAFGQQESDRC